MNEYKVILSRGYQAEFTKADRVEYTPLGFVIFYIGCEVVAIINNPLSVIKKPL